MISTRVYSSAKRCSAIFALCKVSASIHSLPILIVRLSEIVSYFLFLFLRSSTSSPLVKEIIDAASFSRWSSTSQSVYALYASAITKWRVERSLSAATQPRTSIRCISWRCKYSSAPAFVNQLILFFCLERTSMLSEIALHVSSRRWQESNPWSGLARWSRPIRWPRWSRWRGTNTSLV